MYIKISQTRKQKLNEPYCGPITYCAISGEPISLVETFHKQARMKPSNAFLYLSFHKLNNKIKSYVEVKGNLIKKEDLHWFNKLHGFDKSLVSQDNYFADFLKNNQILFKKYKKNITILHKLNHLDYRRIILENLVKNEPIGAMIMVNLKDYDPTKNKFYVPHWITIHGIIQKPSTSSYLIYDSYNGKSKWLKEEDLFALFDLNRKYHFSPQFVYLS
jgi:hypothetical protein